MEKWTGGKKSLDGLRISEKVEKMKASNKINWQMNSD